MNVDQTSLAAAFTGLKATFAEALSKLEPDATADLMAEVPSTTSTEVYPVAALLGDLEQVLDEVTMTNIGRYVASVENVPYARAVQVKRDDIADDHLGLYKPAIQQLARRAGQYHIRLAAQALLGGFATVWTPDGAMIFSAAHQWPGGVVVWNNLGVPAALNAANFDIACLALETRTDPAGTPMGLETSHLVVGPALRAAGEGIVNTRQIAGTDNIYFGRAKLVVLPRFGASRAWLLMAAGYGKPMVLQNREGPEFTADEDVTSHVAFYQEKYAYKARRRCAVAILAPWLIEANEGV